MPHDVLDRPAGDDALRLQALPGHGLHLGQEGLPARPLPLGELIALIHGTHGIAGLRSLRR